MIIFDIPYVITDLIGWLFDVVVQQKHKKSAI